MDYSPVEKKKRSRKSVVITPRMAKSKKETATLVKLPVKKGKKEGKGLYIDDSDDDIRF